MKKFFSYLTAVVCAVVLFSSCSEVGGSVNQDKLLGTWKLVSTTTYFTDGESYTEYADAETWATVKFTETSCIFNSYDMTEGDITAVPYTLDGNTLYVMFGLLELEIEKLTNKELVLRQDTVSDNDFVSGELGVKYSIMTYSKM